VNRTDPVTDLEILIRSRYGIIHIDTLEDERVQSLLRMVSDRLTVPFFIWTRSRGICRDGHLNGVYDTGDVAKALAHVVASDTAGIYHFVGVGTLLQNEANVDRLKDAAENLGNRRGAIVLSGDDIAPPPSLSRLLATMELPHPDINEYRSLLQQVKRDVGKRAPVDVELSAEDEDRLLHNLRGLTLLEASRVITRAIVEDNRLSSSDIEHVMRAKKEIVEREGILEYYPAEMSMADVADLAGLKAWLSKRKLFLTQADKAQEFGLSFPKGVLLIGVPGCGKSLCARAVATEWGLPLLKMDTASLYNKFVGETERNFRRAMQTAERLSPCVLFIDELEKAFAAGGGTEDGGLSHRVLGSFLSWLQDRSGDVFTVATANDIDRLPPELLRKGRFDEVFFVDLPNADARADILAIHLRRRKQDPAAIDIPAVVAATDGFSGAEIEQVIVSALYTAFAGTAQVTTALLLHEAAATRPLSVTMAEKVAALRSWAKDRTVSAN
jgi:SpoVK/Ycf46/Vps4 family AAA+-type ATPase